MKVISGFRFVRLVSGIFLFISLGHDAFSEVYNPEVSPEAVVTAGSARFSVLTPRVIRMEWSESGVFEDGASLTFINRRLPVPAFKVVNKNGLVTITTTQLKLSYDSNSGKFSEDNLSIHFKNDAGGSVKWHPGLRNAGDLLGTYRTLDQYDGDTRREGKEVTKVKLEQGLLSREGWTLIDDSSRPIFDSSDWPWVTARSNQETDWYFFAYGQDYKAALKDFTDIAGKIPIPPKFTFGIWWSKFHAYTDMEYRELVEEYKNHRLPLDVMVMDMDWHITNRKEWYSKDGKKKPSGWTGYTWEEAYFPDPAGFLKWTDTQGLKVCLNLHPAQGILPHESVYEDFSRSLNLDPAKKAPVKFEITRKEYAKSYFDFVIHPLERQGVDFWWLDWQQGGQTDIPGVNPTFYLNYVHFSDMQRQGRRPLIYHRYGGLGNHRYQIGFSGDTHITWNSLAYQPYFTATAANVCFGYWSHDIGGHMKGQETSELYTRWVQWGVFSPVFRTHSARRGTQERRVWAHPFENFKIMRDAMQLRYKLFPYIYAAARNAHETGVSIVKPMYYDYPDKAEAYQYKGQYMFGDDFVVAPVTSPMNDGQFYIMQEVWLPDGNWIEYATGTVLNGGQVVKRPYRLSEVPLFVRAGAVIPMQEMPECGLAQIGEKALGDLVLNIYPGASGEAVVYDDEGSNENYLRGDYSKIRIRSDRNGNLQTVKIHPVEGSFPGMTAERVYTVRLHLVYPPVSVKIDGVPHAWSYDGQSLAAVIETASRDVRSPVTIEVVFTDGDLKKLSGKPGMFQRLMAVNQYNNLNWMDWSFSRTGLFLQDIAAAAQTGHRISLQPDAAGKELGALEASLAGIRTALTAFAGSNTNHMKMLDFFNAAISEPRLAD